MIEDIGLFEAIYTQRALRYIKPDPLPDALIRKVLGHLAFPTTWTLPPCSRSVIPPTVTGTGRRIAGPWRR
jgi:hypothetical protein